MKLRDFCNNAISPLLVGKRVRITKGDWCVGEEGVIIWFDICMSYQVGLKLDKHSDGGPFDLWKLELIN